MIEAQRLARDHGFEFWKFGKGSHQLWRHPNGQIVTLIKTYNGRNLRNFEAELRRKTR